MNLSATQRQNLRTRQRGHLSRSTILALFGFAVLALAVTQVPRVLPLIPQQQEKLIAWSARQGFTVEHVDVAGRKAVPAATILQAMALQRGTPIFSCDIAAAQERLAQNPWFKKVTIERRLPQTIFVQVMERIPVARWQVDGKFAVVDGEGVVLATDNLEQYNTLPLIVGQEARYQLVDLFNLLRAQPEIARQVTAATWIGNRRWDLTLADDIVVKLPADKPADALAQLANYDRKQQVFARDIRVVDLRLPGKAVIEPTTRANTLIERPDFSDAPDKKKKEI